MCPLLLPLGSSAGIPIGPTPWRRDGFQVVDSSPPSPIPLPPHRRDARVTRLKDSTAKPMNLLSRGKEPPHVTHRDSRTFRVITITTTWLVRTRPGSRVHSLSAPYTLLATHTPL